jgi:AraC-like DNA-binding protein
MEAFRLFFKDGIGVYSGHVATTKPHAHHATEIIYCAQGQHKIIDNSGKENFSVLSIIPHDIKHQFSYHENSIPVFIFMDPFHQFSERLKQTYQLDKKIICLQKLPDEQIINEFNHWIMGKEIDVLHYTRLLVDQLTDHHTYSTQSDHRIVNSIQHIKESLSREMRIEDMASKVHLSASRYAHLFKEYVGIPFRRYILWARMQSTVESILQGNSLTTACYDGGFSDLPHFSKTFTEMFGVAPSSVLKG